MRAASLLAVFLVAKVAVLEGRGLVDPGWAVLAFVWQDVAVALAVAVLDAASARSPLGWTVYGLAVGYTALNVAVARVLSTPLTMTMLRATRPELGDSVRPFLTAEHLAWPAAVAAVGILVPFALRRTRRPPLVTLAGPALAIVALGPAASRRVDTAGLDRNALAALPMSARPRIAATPAEDRWRSSPFTPEVSSGLGYLRGAAAGRNVVLVVLESAGAAYLGAYGAPEDPMPTLTALAGEGLLVDGAYAVYPESVKGLVSTLSSQYTAFDTPPERYARLEVPSLGHVFGRAGYDTGLFHSGRFMYLGMDAVVADRGFDTVEDAGAIGGQHDSSFGIDEASAVRRILEWIDGRPRDRPFFVTYLPIAGHHPYATVEPGPFPEEREIDRYRNALYEADRAVAGLRRGLSERGLFESTLWAVVGDHGEAFGQHPGNYGHTLFIYEENVRVPFVVAVPGVLKETVRVRAPASLVDLAPTVLDLAGLSIPGGYDGRSLLAGPPGMSLFYTDYSLGWLGLRDGCLKYIHAIETGRSRLFDLCHDPEEGRDLSAGLAERVTFYRRHLERWSAAQKARSQMAFQGPHTPIMDGTVGESLHGTLRKP